MLTREENETLTRVGPGTPGGDLLRRYHGAEQGVTRIEDMTNQLPQVFAAQGSNVSNGASGTAQVNLRGLGANGGLADTSTNGGTTAFSSSTDTASLTLNSVNDAPVLAATDVEQTATEDALYSITHDNEQKD